MMLTVTFCTGGRVVEPCTAAEQAFNSFNERGITSFNLRGHAALAGRQISICGKLQRTRTEPQEEKQGDHRGTVQLYTMLAETRHPTHHRNGGSMILSSSGCGPTPTRSCCRLYVSCSSKVFLPNVFICAHFKGRQYK